MSKVIISPSPVAILLSTYNSALFITALLDSIINQTFREFCLYVRDDGSDDCTTSIIRDYSSKYKNIVFVEDNFRNLGPARSFLFLLEKVDSEYYMFCDHDDVWLPTKIEYSYSHMLVKEKCYSNIPILVFSDLYVTNSSLNILSNSFMKMHQFNIDYLSKDFRSTLLCNYIPGCAMFFNKQSKLVLTAPSPYLRMHDSWLAAHVLAFGGKIFYLEKPLIYYRQHDANSLGAFVEKKSLWFRLKIFFKNINNDFLCVNSIKPTSLFAFAWIKIKAYYFRYRSI